MTRPTQNRTDREKLGFAALLVLGLVVIVLLGLVVMTPGRTAADNQASAAAVEQMDQAQARDTAARRHAETGQRSEFN